MAQENANVLRAALHCVVEGDPAAVGIVRVVASTGVDLASLLQPVAGHFQFTLLDGIPDEELIVSIADGVRPGVAPSAIESRWARVAGDPDLRTFEVQLLDTTGLNIRNYPFAIEFWQIPPIGPSVAFPPAPPAPP